MNSNTLLSDTIVAQASAQGSGAIGIIRVSGPHSFAVVDTIAQVPSGKKLIDFPSHSIVYGYIKDMAGNRLDQVLFMLMRAPRTFTGEDVIEINCHNNQFLIEQIIHLLLVSGARMAAAGEFTQRAFLNNKIDLLQAEAINELIQANGQEALKHAFNQLKGSFSAWIAQLEKKIMQCLAYSEASFEFIDEELEFDTQIKEHLCLVLEDITHAKKQFDQQKHIRSGIRIALIGAVNAGKSSLFNALIGTQRAIVTNIPGTTRDSIEAGRYRNGYYHTLIDTAGLRHTDDIIEQHGIERSHAEAALADIVLIVYDGARAMTSHEQEVYQELLNQYHHKALIVRTKKDLPAVHEWLTLAPQYALDTSDKKDIEMLEMQIEERVQQLLTSSAAPFLLNQRHYQLLCAVEQRLLHVRELLENDKPYELISYLLKDALEQLSELTGRTIQENALNAIFREFCVGK
jgi:tRNA modification GTPase